MKSADRLLQFIEKQGISKRSFYDTVGLSNGFLDKSSNLGSDKLEKIIYSYPDLNIIWVITGEGEMFKSDNKADVTPNATASVDDENTLHSTSTPVATSGNKTTSTRKAAPPTAPPTNILVPKYLTVDSNGKENIVHISIKAAAGYLQGFGDPEYMEHLPVFNLPGLTDASYRSFEVDGDSMYPTLKNRQMVIGRWVERLEDIRDDRVYIVIHKTLDVVIKRLIRRGERIFAKSDATNDREMYKTFEIFPEDIKEVWYAVFNGGFDFQSPSDLWKRLNNTEADLAMVLNILKQNKLLPDSR